MTLSRIPIDISFVDSNGNIVNEDKVTVPIEDLDEWRIKGNTHISGSYTIEYQAESRPNGNGGSAETLLETIEITLEPKADKPTLDINEAMTPINVSNTGWIDLGSIVDSLDSSDTDGSEKLYARIEFLDLNNRLVDLKDGAMLSTQFFIRQNESWIVQQSEVERLKIYVGELEDEIRIKMTPIFRRF